MLLLDVNGFFDCNSAAVKAMKAGSKADIMVHPALLSAEFQPDGSLSLEKAGLKIKEAYAVLETGEGIKWVTEEGEVHVITTGHGKFESGSDEMEKKLTEMGMHLVHKGVGFSLKPIGWDALQTEANGKTIQLGKVDLLIDSQLKKNDVPLDANNPMSAMMLLSYFNADGKLVLSKKDLEQLSATMPPEMIGMLMMFAKYEGENAVFILKFENGHLMINGQPVM
jgi:hypothetical protein